MKLVDADAVRDLLTDNVDDRVSCFVIFTQNGTLLSHSRPQLRQSLIKFTPFAGAIWRNHATQVSATGNTHHSIGGLPGIKTLDFKLKGQGKGLAQVTVEMDGVTSVIREIQPRLLLAAQMESDHIGSRGTSSADGVEGSTLEDRDHSSSESPDEPGSEQDGSGDQSTDDQHEDEDSKQEKRDGVAGHVSRMRILELKAEGMAESLALDYPSKLPRDFY